MPSTPAKTGMYPLTLAGPRLRKLPTQALPCRKVLLDPQGGTILLQKSWFPSHHFSLQPSSPTKTRTARMASANKQLPCVSVHVHACKAGLYMGRVFFYIRNTHVHVAPISEKD